MFANESTLPESRRLALVACSVHDTPENFGVASTALESPHSRERCLALRAGIRHGWWGEETWCRFLADVDVDVRREVATRLARRRDLTPAAIGVLIAMLADHDALTVDAAAFALGELESPVAVAELCRVAQNHEDARCRESAIAALGAIGDPQSLDTVLSALDDKAPVRRRAIVALSNFEGPRVDAALLAALDDRDWQVRAAATQLGD